MNKSQVNEMLRELLETKEVRDKYRDRLEVIDEVKELVHLVGLKVFTREEIAEYFDTSVSTIKRVTHNYSEELRENGFRQYDRPELLDLVAEVATGKEMADNKSSKGLTTITVGGIDVDVPNRGARMFTKEGALSLAMLLDESSGSYVAYRIQLKLLGIKEEEIEDDVIVENIIEEDNNVNLFNQELVEQDDMDFDFEYVEAVENDLMLKIVNTDDKVERAVAVQEFKLFKEREKLAEIQYLKSKYQIEGESDKPYSRNKVIIELAKVLNTRTEKGFFITGWTRIFEELQHSYGININARKMKVRGEIPNPSVFDVLYGNEFDYLIESIKLLLKRDGVNIHGVINKNENMREEAVKMGII